MTTKQTRKNSEDIRKLLASHQEHLLIANQEMSIVKTDIEWMKGKFEDFEKRFDKLDNRTWAILTTIVIGFLANLYFK